MITLRPSPPTAHRDRGAVHPRQPTEPETAILVVEAPSSLGRLPNLSPDVAFCLRMLPSVE
jgi:hypothetical protein